MCRDEDEKKNTETARVKSTKKSLKMMMIIADGDHCKW
jgi:hypothetical protein